MKYSRPLGFSLSFIFQMEVIMSDVTVTGEKEVNFYKYCPLCKHKDEDAASWDSVKCEECLSYPSNTYSHKPVNFEEA